MKNSFSLIELLIVIFLSILISSFFYSRKNEDNLQIVAKRLALYLKQTRYQAMIDDKEEKDNPLWHKKRWTLKFFRCKKDVGGIYYVIYSDINMKGHPNQNESLIDPLTQKRIYSSNSCEVNNKNSKYVLLTKEFGINSVSLSCNKTSGLGQISFGNDGKVYAKLSSNANSGFEYEINKNCEIVLKSQDNKKIGLKIESNTGFVGIKE